METRYIRLRRVRGNTHLRIPHHEPPFVVRHEHGQQYMSDGGKNAFDNAVLVLQRTDKRSDAMELERR